MRIDLRRPDQLRPVRFTRGFTQYAEGSVLVEFGETRVLCNVSVEDRVPDFLKGTGKGWVTAEYGMLPRATHTRVKREAVTGQQSGRTQEIQRLIGRSLRVALDLDLLGEYTLRLDCDVLQADGGTRTAAMTGGCVALHEALRKMQADGRLEQSPFLHPVAAISAGIVDGIPMLDLNYEEDSRCDTDMNVAMTSEGHFVEIQGTAEGAPLRRPEINELMDLATAGCRELVSLQLQVMDTR